MRAFFRGEGAVPLKLVVPSLAALALSACAVGDRGIEPLHKIQVSGNVAHVPDCPDWSDAQINAGEAMGANFGCATHSNLALMIADPNDLVHGQVAKDSDAIATVRALKAYRELIPTGTKELDKTKAAGGGGN